MAGFYMKPASILGRCGDWEIASTVMAGELRAATVTPGVHPGVGLHPATQPGSPSGMTRGGTIRQLIRG
jgi:hypothetical protein